MTLESQNKKTAERIQTLRKYLGLSKSAFASQLGMSSTHVTRLENGTTKASDQLIRQICRTFQVDSKFFTQDEMNPEEAVHQKPSSEVPLRLKKARLEKGLSQQQLADLSGVNQPVISNVEAGGTLTLKQAQKLAAALEIGSEWLLYGNEEKKDYPADELMINWLWKNKDKRKIVWEWMKEK